MTRYEIEHAKRRVLSRPLLRRLLLLDHPAGSAPRHALLVLACVISCYPLIWMVFGSLKSPTAFYTNLYGPPLHPMWSNWSTAWQQADIGVYLLNSVIDTVCTIAIVCVCGYLLAYAIARLRIRGANVLLAVFAVTLFVPSSLLIIPLYVLESHTHLLGNWWSLFLPYAAAGLPFSVIMLVAYLRALPTEIEEAARVDGAGRLRVLWSVMVPLSRPAFATVVIVTFLQAWNEFLLAMTLVPEDAKRTLPVGILNFQSVYQQSNYSLMFAALSMSVIPIAIVFVIFQRQFIGGLTAGAIKM